jgi:8-amino-7-oxononanoate synthase
LFSSLIDSAHVKPSAVADSQLAGRTAEDGPASAGRLVDRVARRLAELDAGGLTRTLRVPGGIDLSSNDYLKLSRHPRLVTRFAEAVAREGCGSTGSRLLSGHRDGFNRIERRFAAFKAADRALYFSSGYLANIAVLTTLTEPGDVIFSDARNHASLIDGARLSRADRVVFPHNDVAALTALMDASPSTGVHFVVVESVFSMDGDFAPLADYVALCEARDAALVVDEAHAVGVYGARGSGRIEESLRGVPRPPGLISVNPCGKALGVAGAFAAGPAWAIEYVMQRARPFVFSTAAPPALAAALDASLDLIETGPERRHRVRALARYLRSGLQTFGIAVPEGDSPIVPIVIGDARETMEVARSMVARGFDVRGIRPPSVPAGTARLRASVNVDLTEDDLDRFVAALVDTRQVAENIAT